MGSAGRRRFGEPRFSEVRRRHDPASPLAARAARKQRPGVTRQELRPGDRPAQMDRRRRPRCRRDSNLAEQPKQDYAIGLPFAGTGWNCSTATCTTAFQMPRRPAMAGGFVAGASRWMISRREPPLCFRRTASSSLRVRRRTTRAGRFFFESSSRSIFLFEHDLRANASRLSRGKTGTHPSGRGPRACFSGSCSKHPSRFAACFRPQALRSGTPSPADVPACRPCRTGSCRRFDAASPAGTASTR
jgi:hypothetical protein